MDYKNKDWLQYQYVEEGLTCKQIADICGCHERTIHQRLIGFNIARRHSGWHWENLKRWRAENPDWVKHSRKKRQGWSLESKRKRSLKYRGAGHPSWKGGLTELVKGIRRSPEFYQWRKAVLQRDNHTCQDCGKAETLEAHHIRSLIDYPEGIFEVGNGLTLCEDCHKRHTRWQGVGKKK